jgi:hypothetical protein
VAHDSSEISRALAAYPGLTESPVAPLAGGLIHQSFSVPHRDVEYILQRVSPIFSPGIHENMLAVTEHLYQKGVCTFRLLPTKDGRPYTNLGEAGIWRLMTRVPGVTFETCTSPEQARTGSTGSTTPSPRSQRRSSEPRAGGSPSTVCRSGSLMEISSSTTCCSRERSGRRSTRP